MIAQHGTPLEMLRGYANGNNGEWSRFVVLCTKRDSRPRRSADLWICMPVARAWVHTSRVCVGVGVSVGVRGGVGACVPVGVPVRACACLWACLWAWGVRAPKCAIGRLIQPPCAGVLPPLPLRLRAMFR